MSDAFHVVCKLHYLGVFQVLCVYQRDLFLNVFISFHRFNYLMVVCHCPFELGIPKLSRLLKKDVDYKTGFSMKVQTAFCFNHCCDSLDTSIYVLII